MNGALEVHLDAINLDPTMPAKMGVLAFREVRGSEIASFRYDEAWLKNGLRFSLDPDLGLFQGDQYSPPGKDTFGIFTDSCPDRWGRMLLDRNERAAARKEKRPVRTLRTSDYLVGVSDVGRMGAMRFCNLGEQTFLASSEQSEVPPFSDVRELALAAQFIDQDPDLSAKSQERLALLLAPGSSLGGARPKASVRDQENELWIAKFPRSLDAYDASGSEMLCACLAKSCGIDQAESRLERIDKRRSIFLTKRFDRLGKKRIHFASAMTLLGKTDGPNAENTSYLDLAEFIRTYGSNPVDDLVELFRRQAFSIAVSNTDDHLRNHGFLLERDGWKLSPAFDLNPNPEKRGLTLNISETDNALDFSLLCSQALYYGIAHKEALEMVSDIRKQVASWKAFARRLHLDEATQSRLSAAFAQASSS